MFSLGDSSNIPDIAKCSPRLGITAPVTFPMVKTEQRQSSSKRRKRESAPSYEGKNKHSIARRQLPVYKFKRELCKLIAEKEVVLVVAETGSGKSTQIPAYVHESGIIQKHSKHAKSICVTQPRRVAAVTVAHRVAEEMGCTPGTTVGHRVRFDDCTDQGQKKTRIIYATDGMLLREAMADPLLTRYGLVCLDESHERSMQTDILFGVVRRAMDARRGLTTEEKQGSKSKDDMRKKKMRDRAQEMGLPELKVIVMSATLDVETFQAFFPGAGTIKIPGRQFPVQIVYTAKPQEDYLESALNTALQIHEEADDGDILVFLPGQEEIENVASLLRKHLIEDDMLARLSKGGSDTVQSLFGMGTDVVSAPSIVNGVLICVLYAALPPETQMLAFQPRPAGCKRKIILATNIAETSVTLEGVHYVVDTGKHKMRDFSAGTGMESLIVEDISKAQAAQRTGRAGRTSEGVCFRLYTEDAFDSLRETTVPEIMRVNLAQVVLLLKGMGVHNPARFDFLQKPKLQTIKRASGILFALGALDEYMDLTLYGKKLAKLPLDPVYGHLLLQSPKYECTSEMLTAVAMLSAENIFYTPSGEGEQAAKAATAHKRFASHEGDLPTLLAVYEAWRKEAFYSPILGKKAQNRMKETAKSGNKVPHGEWCKQNSINGRALVRAHDVRHQLSAICSRGEEQHGLGLDVNVSCGNDIELFLKCACAGLFLQAASRERTNSDAGPSGRSRGKYRTKVGNKSVSVHPSSALFGRNPPPKCVVYTELLVTKKTYIRGVTQVREEWLIEIAPNFYQKA